MHFLSNACPESLFLFLQLHKHPNQIPITKVTDPIVAKIIPTPSNTFVGNVSANNKITSPDST